VGRPNLGDPSFQETHFQLRLSGLQVRPDLVPIDQLGDSALAVIAFGPPAPGALLSIDMLQLGSTMLAEVWRAEGDVKRGIEGDVVFAATDDVVIAAVSCDAHRAQTAATCVYDRLIAFVRQAGYPHLLRVWNHVSNINEHDEELERYRGFCAGRHDSFSRYGYEMRADLPAGTGVGMNGAGLKTYCIAAREPASSIENPRQVSAYNYPERYGPRSPSFSRATIAGNVVFVSGTASIVGHETRHEGDVILQLSETLMNLEFVLAAAHARELAVAKVYLRHADDYPFVAARLRIAWPRTKTIFLRADLCRAELLVEVEGVAFT